MADKKPTSFKVFIAVASITALIFLTATLFSYYQVNMKYSMILALCMFIALAFTTVGIYAGFKFRSVEKRSKIFNRVGLIGNVLIFLFTILIMTFAALTTGN